MAKVKFGLRLLETLTSALYDNPLIVFREYVQNSIDAYNSMISMNTANKIDDFHISVNIDSKTRSIKILDNGYAIPDSGFREKMTSIGISNKNSLPDQIGFRGIGRLSAMPFCQKLTFTNKPKGSKKILSFQWDGVKFRDMLNMSEEPELEKSIHSFTEVNENDYSGSIDDHFFCVDIDDYNEDIAILINSKDFEYNLKLMLPLNYDPQFTEQNEIKKHYQKFMGASIEKFCFDIRLNGNTLFKPYENDHILKSGINFWDLSYPSDKDGIPGEKIGILWFTFNPKVSANPVNEPYGIFVRSKNMLMGDHNALADAMVRVKTDDYITTFGELTIALRGVYGEMLINSPLLKDNAKRDWFKINQKSLELRHIIGDFLKQLHTYRYVASKAFKSIENDTNKKRLKDAYINLTSTPEPQKILTKFFKEAKVGKSIKANKNFEYADDDIPAETVTFKRYYEKILTLAREYFVEKKDLQEFIRFRVFIKKKLNKE